MWIFSLKVWLTSTTSEYEEWAEIGSDFFGEANITKTGREGGRLMCTTAQKDVLPCAMKEISDEEEKYFFKPQIDCACWLDNG